MGLIPFSCWKAGIKIAAVCTAQDTINTCISDMFPLMLNLEDDLVIQRQQQNRHISNTSCAERS